jgi:DNA-binding response OmpR family regulator
MDAVEAADDVRMLRWPTDASAVEHCRALGIPRLLLLEGAVPPPSYVGALEDWVRLPAGREDLQARADLLRARRTAADPTVDSDGILRYRGRYLALPPAEAPMARALAASFRHLVHRADLLELVWPDTGAPSRNALDLRVLRLRRRLPALGLVIRTVWGKGYLMDRATGESPR